MKKFFTHLILFTALMLCSASSWAQLMVCGHSVDLNATSTQTITGSGISGTVTYNPSNKTLTLDNATLTSSGINDGIYNQSVEGLDILFRGTVKITTNSDDATVAAIYCDKRTTLTSPGNASAPVITLKNIGNGPAIKVRGAVLHAYGDNISATAANYHAVIGDVYNGTKAALYMHFSILEAKGASGYRAVTGFTGGLSMATSILGTEGASFDETSGSIVNSSNIALQEATIIPALTIGTLYIGDNGDRTITAAKTGATTASGTYTYNSSTKTLTVKNLNVDGTNIISHIPGLTIDFQGGGTLTNSGIAMDLYGNTKLTSDGKVVITGTSSSAIFLNGDYDLEVSMPEFQATSASNGDGINGNNSLTNSGGRLIMTKYNDESVYKFLGTRSNLRVGSIVLNDMAIWSPYSYYNPADKTMYHHGVEACGTDQGNDATWFKSTNNFTYYDLYIAGTHVNNRNSKDIVNSSIKSGKISYDSGSKTLTLNGVTMEVTSNDDPGVRSYIPDLNIVLNGTNKMTTNANLFNLNNATTFSGSGNLEGTSKEKNGISTIAGTNVTIATTNYFAIHAKGYGYWGGGGSDETLTLKKTSSDDLGYAFYGERAALFNVPNLVLDGMAISNSAWPGLVGCYFEDGTIKQNGGNIAVGYVAFKSIKERTGIYVAGQEIVRVNDASYPIYVGSPYIQSGTKSVAYAPDTKTLTLTDATIDYQGSDGNFYDIRFNANVTANIVVNGNNTLTGNEKMFAPLWVRSGSNITASGDGTLNLLNGPLYLYNSSFIAQDNVGINCNQSYIGSNDKSYLGQLKVLDNAVITAKKINLISALDLSANHAITTPAGAEFKDNGVYVGSSLAQNVVIQPTDYTGIDELGVGSDELGVTDLSDAEIYDLSGRRISQLQPGINVIRTKDGKVYKITKK